MISAGMILIGYIIFDHLINKEKLKRRTLEKRYAIDMNILLNKISNADDAYILSPSIEGGRMEFGKLLRLGRCQIVNGEVIVTTKDGENIADARLYVGMIK
jgi:hypothetical protein